MKPLKKISIIGYGAGDAANNLAFTTATMFLLVYYTDVAGISAAAAGTLLLVVRIFDAFADVFAGRMVDKTYSKRWGKFRPFIMLGSLPLLLLTFAVFHVPGGWSANATLVYAYLSYAALGLAYSLVNIPYGSLAGAMTQDPSERAKLGSARTIGAFLIGAVLGMVVAPMLKNDTDLQPIFTTLTVVFLVAGVALYMFCAFTAKEQVQRDVAQVSLKQSISTLKGNVPLLMLCISSLVLLAGSMTLSTVQLYYFRDVMGNVGLYAAASGIQLLLALVLSALMPRLVRRIGKHTVYMAFGGVMMLGGLAVLLAPAGAGVLAVVGVSVVNLGLSGVSIVIWALEADTVEYGEWKTGIRTEGIVYALFSFTRKAGQAIGGALAAYALAWGGYNGAAAVQSDQAILGIQIAAGAIPMVMSGLAVLVMSRYKLTDAVHASIVYDIRERRAAAAAAKAAPANEDCPA
ncbi:glucuronide transporter [Paeniglutamicibacter sp. NPDC091659]|uniref:glucuronide transporter n=1 Tax=Paeniglutamicibacter sp. NPDC091659 TaxID=3364389 RepID=UPI003825B03B